MRWHRPVYPAAAMLLCPAILAAGAAANAPRYIRVPARLQTEGPAPEPKSFDARIDKARARIVRVLTPSDPQLILLVLDLVGDLSLVEPAKTALMAEVAKLPPDTHIGLLRAQDGLTVLMDPSNDREAVSNAIRGLTISGHPGLLETLDPIERVADAVGRKSQVRLSILYVTDSNVASYREDFSNPVINSSDPHDLSRRFPAALIQEKLSKIQGPLAAHQTPLHIVHIAYRSDLLNEAYQSGLDRLAVQMGGSAVFCRSQAEIPDAIHRAFRTIVAEYDLILAVPEGSSNTPQIQITAGDAPLVYRTRMTLKEK